MWLSDSKGSKKKMFLQLFFILCLHWGWASSTWMTVGLLGGSPPSLSVPGLQADQPAGAPQLPEVCQALPGLTTQQVNLCSRLPETVESVPFGTKRGLVECEYQFRNELWNCSDNRDSRRIQQTIERGSKETAFLYAVTSAGVVHTIARDCASGNLTECGCDSRGQGQSTPEGWKWGGCSDNLRYGVNFARKFIDGPDKRQLKKTGELRNLMNLHNNKAGRMALSRLMLMKCRCHGVSGSCNLKTCWRSLPRFADIGDYLKEKYDKSAVKVSGLEGGKSSERFRRGVTDSPAALPVSKRSLVYIQPSPDYCSVDPQARILGPSGRRCNADSDGRDGCQYLCCGRGHRTEVVVEYEKCHCKFVWCCKVQCKKCRRKKQYHTCK